MSITLHISSAACLYSSEELAIILLINPAGVTPLEFSYHATTQASTSRTDEAQQVCKGFQASQPIPGHTPSKRTHCNNQQKLEAWPRSLGVRV